MHWTRELQNMWSKKVTELKGKKTNSQINLGNTTTQSIIGRNTRQIAGQGRVTPCQPRESNGHM